MPKRLLLAAAAVVAAVGLFVAHMAAAPFPRPTDTVSTSATKTASTTAPLRPTTRATSPMRRNATGSYPCLRTGAQDHCEFGPVPYIVDPNMSGEPFINQNIWAGGSDYKQTLYAASNRDWYVRVNADSHWGGVQAYPNIGFFTVAGRVADMKPTTTTWDVDLPRTDNVAGWAAYDLWFNGWADEVMIQPDFHAPSSYSCDTTATATFGGDPWFMCQFASERVWAPGRSSADRLYKPSGSLDVKAILTWMIANGHLPPDSTWTAASFGFEPCDTQGVTETFRVKDFSWLSG